MSTGIRHGAGFVASGTLAFITDASILALLTRGAGLDPFSARLIAIACAMIVGFFAHRRFTFAVQETPTLAQFLKFIGVAATASVINFAIYAGILFLRPGTEPLIALVAATAVSMGVSYARTSLRRIPQARGLNLELVDFREGLPQRIRPRRRQIAEILVIGTDALFAAHIKAVTLINQQIDGHSDREVGAQR